MPNLFSKYKSALIIVCIAVLISTPVISLPKQADAQGINVPIGTLTDWNSDMAHLKDFVLDHMAVMIANQLIQRMTASVVNWINSGFNGSPAFLNNPQAFFTDVADQVTGAFIADTGILSQLCSPYSLDLRLSLALQQANLHGYSRYSCTITSVINNYQGASVGLDASVSNKGATAGDILSGNILNNPGQLNVNGKSAAQVDQASGLTSFLNGNFSAGGWPGFLALTTETQNNPYGAYLYAQSDLNAQIAAKHSAVNADLNRGNGFLSWQSCKDVTKQVTARQYDKYDQLFKSGNQTVSTGKTDLGQSTSVSSKVDKDGNTTYQDCETETPGTLIGGSLQRVANIPADKLVLVKTISDSIDQITGALVNQMLSQGLLALSKSGTSVGTGKQSYLAQLQAESDNMKNNAEWLNASSQLHEGLIPPNDALAKYLDIFDQAVNDINYSLTQLQTAQACFEAKVASRTDNLSDDQRAHGQGQVTAIDTYITGNVNPLLASTTAAQKAAETKVDMINAAASAVSSPSDLPTINSSVSGYGRVLKQNLASSTVSTDDTKAANDLLKFVEGDTKDFNTKATLFQKDCDTLEQYDPTMFIN